VTCRSGRDSERHVLLLYGWSAPRLHGVLTAPHDETEKPLPRNLCCSAGAFEGHNISDHGLLGSPLCGGTLTRLEFYVKSSSISRRSVACATHVACNRFSWLLWVARGNSRVRTRRLHHASQRNSTCHPTNLGDARGSKTI
jgi:hypothetical protein